MNEDKMRELKDRLEKITKELEITRNLRDELGSKVILLDSYKRFLELTIRGVSQDTQD